MTVSAFLVSFSFFFCLVRVVVLLLFFFQAEDGIRDLTVTGVQTCALPICGVAPAHRLPVRRGRRCRRCRSEERRVGKECRSRWRSYDEKKKNGAVIPR